MATQRYRRGVILLSDKVYTSLTRYIGKITILNNQIAPMANDNVRKTGKITKSALLMQKTDFIINVCETIEKKNGLN